MESGTQLINVRSLGAKLKIVISRCKRRRFEPLFIAFYLIPGTGFAGNVQLPTMPSREATISWPTILTLLEDRSERAPLSGDTNAQTGAILWLHKSQRRPRTGGEREWGRSKRNGNRGRKTREKANVPQLRLRLQRQIHGRKETKKTEDEWKTNNTGKGKKKKTKKQGAGE